jgi:hypothetical protein
VSASVDEESFIAIDSTRSDEFSCRELSDMEEHEEQRGHYLSKRLQSVFSGCREPQGTGCMGVPMIYLRLLCVVAVAAEVLDKIVIIVGEECLI